jgi:hypothetical protein
MSAHVSLAEHERIPSYKKLFDNRSVTFEEVDVREIGDLNPGYLLEDYVLRVAVESTNKIETQRNRGSLQIAMSVLVNQYRLAHFNGQFFPQLAAQGVDIGLRLFDLASRKLPFEWKLAVWPTLANQQSAVSIDKPGNNVDHFGGILVHGYTS